MGSGIGPDGIGCTAERKKTAGPGPAAPRLRWTIQAGRSRRWSAFSPRLYPRAIMCPTMIPITKAARPPGKEVRLAARPLDGRAGRRYAERNRQADADRARRHCRVRARFDAGTPARRHCQGEGRGQVQGEPLRQTRSGSRAASRPCAIRCRRSCGCGLSASGRLRSRSGLASIEQAFIELLSRPVRRRWHERQSSSRAAARDPRTGLNAHELPDGPQAAHPLPGGRDHAA